MKLSTALPIAIGLTTFVTPALADSSNANPGAAIATLVIFFACYFFPTMIAVMRGHNNALAIGMFNLFLAWTGLGWFAALIWACTNPGGGVNGVVIHNNIR